MNRFYAELKTPQAWIDKLGEGLALTIENFAKWVKQYLDKKGSDQRLVFLAVVVNAPDLRFGSGSSVPPIWTRTVSIPFRMSPPLMVPV